MVSNATVPARGPSLFFFQETEMPCYRVSFFKTVSDDTGHERAVCQRAVEVEANDPDAALRPARELFCKLENIPHWSVHADSCATEALQLQPAPDRRAPEAPQDAGSYGAKRAS
jgi:hypothetical protein